MSPYYSLLILFASLLFSFTSCKKEQNSNPDQIHYQDIEPDTTLSYTVHVIEEQPYQWSGAFAYNIDLDDDGIIDYVIGGNSTPGHFDHTDQTWVNDHDNRITGKNENTFIGQDFLIEDCNKCGLTLNDTIDDRFLWARASRISFRIVKNLVSCKANGEYLPLKLIIDNKTHYGWLKITPDEKPTISEMAINMAPGKQILAGQKQ